MLGYRGILFSSYLVREEAYMLSLWKNEQKNGENDESSPLLVLGMSCDGSLSGFLGLPPQSCLKK